ncbi:MAG: tetratricopeptide repeat protein [Halieaceae bacterium]
MEAYRTEEEQVEALRKWWDENGRSTLLAIALALGVGFGWQGWQQHSANVAAEASARYDEMLDAVRETRSEAQVSTTRHLAEGIKNDYPGTTYAQFAALHLARLAMIENDTETAEQELRWVLTSNPDTELRLLTELRLARVEAARGNPEQGLEIISAAEPGAFEPAFLEAKGDMYLQLGQREEAIIAYEQALGLAAASGVGASEALQLKLRALTPISAREATPESAPETGRELPAELEE